MQLTETEFTDAKPIDGYGPGFFRVGGEVFEGAVLVRPGAVQSWQGYGDTESLQELAGQIDVLFVGTGAETAHLPPDFRAELEEAGLGVEAMPSPSACRTYNVLVAEGRRIAAALLPV